MKNLNVSNKQEFEQFVKNSEKPVLLDFYADWCGPCQAQTPLLEAFAGDYSGRVDFAKIDVDAHADISRQLGIRSIPTLALYASGEHVATHVGVADRKTLQSFLAKVV